MAYKGFEGGLTVAMPLGGEDQTSGKESSPALESEGYGLNEEQLIRFDWILNSKGLSPEQFKNNQEDAIQNPSDYPSYNDERFNRLLTNLKNFEAQSSEFREAVETLAQMVQ